MRTISILLKVFRKKINKKNWTHPNLYITVLFRKRRLCLPTGSSHSVDECMELKGGKLKIYYLVSLFILIKKSFVNGFIIILTSHLGGIKYRERNGNPAVAFVKYNHQFFGIRTTAIHIALT